MPARRASAVLREGLSVAVDRERAAVGLELAEQDPRQLELPASHEAVDAEHLAGARLERDVAQAAASESPLAFSTTGRSVGGGSMMSSV